MQKITIIGLTGSGKTTLAHKISEKFSIPIYYLDLMFWNENGHVTDDVFTNEQEEIMKHEKWIIDGGFPRSKSLDIRIQHADTIIFFDLPLHLVFWRQFKRYMNYYNTIRPDFGKVQPFPFTMKDLKYAATYPRKEIYKKLDSIKDNKKIFVIKNHQDEVSLLAKM